MMKAAKEMMDGKKRRQSNFTAPCPFRRQQDVIQMFWLW